MALRHGSKRRETFFKVQKWNPRIAAWTDERKKTFDTLEAARGYVEQSSKNTKLRIVQYESGAFVEVQ